ncbi:MAG: serine/threonine-protein kinase [Myxococcota bacterium]|nr:serine/threonine-protein kinase [Myxococcota bacterium]
MEGAGTTTSAGGRELLQKRVAAFAASFGGIMLVGVLARTVAVLSYPEQLSFVPATTMVFQFGATACLLAIYLLTRGRPRSARFVRVVEATGLLGAGACLEVVAYGMTERLLWAGQLDRLLQDPTTQLFGLFALLMPMVGASFVLTYALVMRAAFVPTSAKHTAILTLAVGSPLVVIGWLAGSGVDGARLEFFSSSSLALGGAAQWVVTTLVCTMISKVIYGLREEVREAQRLGQYTLEGLIGEGGMGMVYRASHAMLRRPTAIKLLAPERAGRESLERFEREVQLTSQLTHPNTVTIFDYGRTADGVLYYAMELLDGATVEEVVEIDGPQPPARVVRVMEQVAGALGEAHAIGLIHRDVKPANIVLARQGGEHDVAKVVDFGLVKEIERRVGATVSREGTISGTPLYMAPEILTEPDAGSPRSDLYALGAVGYYMLTGEHVFEGKTVIEILGHHMHSEPLPPSVRLGDQVPEDLERLILDCLAKRPDDRPQTASELRRRLEQCDVPRWTQRKAQLWWEAHGPALTSRRSSGPPPKSATTMTVDLITRRA